jgi:hypothetical protein
LHAEVNGPERQHRRVNGQRSLWKENPRKPHEVEGNCVCASTTEDGVTGPTLKQPERLGGTDAQLPARAPTT